MAFAEVCSHSSATPSTSIRSAAATSGQSTPVAALAATMASVSIISMAAGTMPEAMIALTAFPASVVEGKVAKNVRVASGLRRIRSTTSVTMPSRPSLPTTTPVRSYSGRSGTAPPRSTTLPSCKHRSRAARDVGPKRRSPARISSRTLVSTAVINA